jgi:hypothetical protein
MQMFHFTHVLAVPFSMTLSLKNHEGLQKVKTISRKWRNASEEGSALMGCKNFFV